MLLGDFFTMESDLETAVEGLYVHCLLFQCFVCVNLQASGHKSNSHILKLFTWPILIFRMQERGVVGVICTDHEGLALTGYKDNKIGLDSHFWQFN